MKNKFKFHLLMLGLLTACAGVLAADSTMTLSLHQQMINRLAAAALPHSETRNYQGEVDLGVTRQPWNVTLRYTVLAVEAIVQSSHVDFNAKVRVQGQGVDHTSVAKGRLDVGVNDGKLRLIARNMTLPLRIAPLGVPIDLGSVPADDFLPAAFRTIEIDLAALALPIDLPGQRNASIRLTSARIEFRPPFVLVHSTLGL